MFDFEFMLKIMIGNILVSRIQKLLCWRTF